MTFCYVSDLSKAQAFYSGALELPIALEQRDERGELKAIIFSVTATSFVGVVLVDAESLQGTAVQGDGVTLTFVVPTNAEVDRW